MVGMLTDTQCLQRLADGMRSDARCGRDFLTDWGSESTCAKGQCCSSHGWCGHGEEYCSVSLGCQKGGAARRVALGCHPALPPCGAAAIHRD